MPRSGGGGGSRGGSGSRGGYGSPPRRSVSTKPVPKVEQIKKKQAPPPPPPPPARAAPGQAAPPMQGRQPGMFGQMASIAGGVAVGSAVGQVVGQGLVGLFSGSNSGKYDVSETEVQQYQEGRQLTGPCADEVREFLRCAEFADELTSCDSLNEVLKRCNANKRQA